jgi:hypothetical protein
LFLNKPHKIVNLGLGAKTIYKKQVLLADVGLKYQKIMALGYVPQISQNQLSCFYSMYY